MLSALIQSFHLFRKEVSQVLWRKIIYWILFIKMAPNQNYILTDASGEPVSRTYQYRKVMKPMLERKRRARINRCLDELKELMTNALQTVSIFFRFFFFVFFWNFSNETFHIFLHFCLFVQAVKCKLRIVQVGSFQMYKFIVYNFEWKFLIMKIFRVLIF